MNCKNLYKLLIQRKLSVFFLLGFPWVKDFGGVRGIVFGLCVCVSVCECAFVVVVCGFLKDFKGAGREFLPVSAVKVGVLFRFVLVGYGLLSV